MCNNDPPDPEGSFLCFFECLQYDCAGNDSIEVMDGVTCTAFCLGLAVACDVQ